MLKASTNGDHKSSQQLELFLIEKTKALQNENAALKAANAELSGNFYLLQPQSRTDHELCTRLGTLPRHLIPPFLPPLQNVEAFSSLLGEEIATKYASVFKSNEASDRLQAGVAANASGQSPSRPTSADDAKSTRSSSPRPPSHTTADEANKSPVSSNLVMDKGSPSTAAALEKLQECLRRNVERYMNESLSTAQISRYVRELLSVHNIGQRLFAKYVLGLSQGTVSELLSKPKQWEKLTEKGRDSYRKMHAWASDEHCVYLLKSLVPRKGKNGS